MSDMQEFRMERHKRKIICTYGGVEVPDMTYEFPTVKDAKKYFAKVKRNAKIICKERPNEIQKVDP